MTFYYLFYKLFDSFLKFFFQNSEPFIVTGGVYTNPALLIHKSKISANMAKDNTSQHLDYNRTNNWAISLRQVNKKKYTPIANLDNQNNNKMKKADMDLIKVKKNYTKYNINILI